MTSKESCECSTPAASVGESSEPKTYKVIIGVTASVAAIKIPELTEKLFMSPSVSEIAIVPTETSLKFFNPEDLLETCAKKYENKRLKIWRDADEWSMWNKRGDPVLHIDLGKWADILILAPLDANTLAKISNGICDNLLTCVLRAWDLKNKKPVLFCPAMNTKMWEHPLTEIQIKTLNSFGYVFIPPVEKTLMCGDTGIGAMASVDSIVNSFHAQIGALPLPQ